MIVERVEVDRDTVLVPELVAVGDGGTDGAGILRVRDDPEINRILRIKHARLGPVFRRPIVEWLILVKSGEPSGLRPRRLDHRSVDGNSGSQPRNGDGRTSGSII